MRYLSGTQTLDVRLGRIDKLTIRAFCDADWLGGDSMDHKSQTSFLIYIGSTLINYNSKKKTKVVRSRTEAEFRSITFTVADVDWVRHLVW